MYTSSKLMPNNATDYVSNDIFCNSFNLRPEKNYGYPQKCLNRTKKY